MTDMKVTTCNWCLREAQVHTIEKKLWRFWKIVSAENPTVTSLQNICRKCKSRYEEFSMYIERCKAHASIIDEILCGGHVKIEPVIDVEYRSLNKEEVSKEEPSDIHSTQDRSFQDTTKTSSNAGAVPFRCSLCSKTFTKSNSLNRHMSLHTGDKPDKPFKCSYCSKCFARAGNLKSHIRMHTGERPFKCPQCKKTFTRSCSLNIHLRTHTGEKPFKCSQCNKAFPKSSYLKRHTGVHTGVKPFECPQCNKSFTRPSGLNDHLLRIHTDYKPFKCPHCNKSFALRNQFRNHLRIHARDKSSERPQRSRTFIESDSSNEPVRTDDERLKCSECNQTFARTASLKRHLHLHTVNQSL